jgi:hypothetical protein
MVCTKQPYTKKEAEAILKRMPKRKGQHRKECRTYYCDTCNCWHLTSKEYKEVKAKVPTLSNYEDWRKLIT